MNAHEIDYQIFGEEMQTVCRDRTRPSEKPVCCEAGSFMMDGLRILSWDTISGDGFLIKNKGVLGKFFSAGKRFVNRGESGFMTAFLNSGLLKRKIVCFLLLP